MELRLHSSLGLTGLIPTYPKNFHALVCPHPLDYKMSLHHHWTIIITLHYTASLSKGGTKYINWFLDKTFRFSLGLASFVKICGVHKHLIRLNFKHIMCSVISTLLKNFTRNMKNNMLRIPYKHWIVFSLKSLGLLTPHPQFKVLKKSVFLAAFLQR